MTQRGNPEDLKVDINKTFINKRSV